MTLVKIIKSARDAVGRKDMYSGRFKDCWALLQRRMIDLGFEEKINEFVKLNRDNRMLQFLVRNSQNGHKTVYIYRSHPL